MVSKIGIVVGSSLKEITSISSLHANPFVLITNSPNCQCLKLAAWPSRTALSSAVHTSEIAPISAAVISFRDLACFLVQSFPRWQLTIHGSMAPSVVTIHGSMAPTSTDHRPWLLLCASAAASVRIEIRDPSVGTSEPPKCVKLYSELLQSRPQLPLRSQSNIY